MLVMFILGFISCRVMPVTSYEATKSAYEVTGDVVWADHILKTVNIKYRIHAAKREPPFQIFSQEGGFVGVELESSGDWDQRIGNVLRQELLKNNGGIALDVGGNVGYFTLTLAKLGLHVITIEALPSNAALLVKSVELNNLSKNVRVFNVALSDGQKDVMLCAIFNTPTNGILVPRSQKDEQSRMIGYKGPCIDVEMSTLDKIMIWNKPISIMKMDVEGFEYFVLKGGTSLMSSEMAPCSVIFEYNPILVHRMPYAYTAVMLWDLVITQFGYSMHQLDGKNIKKEEFVKFENGQYVDLLMRQTRKLSHCIY